MLLYLCAKKAKIVVIERQQDNERRTPSRVPFRSKCSQIFTHFVKLLLNEKNPQKTKI
jgi:hypothetical protein